MIPAFDRIDHIHLYATNRNQAEQWYADVMGFKRVPELESWADGGPLTLSNSSGTVHIALFEAAAQPCRSVIALSVGAAGVRRLAPAPGRQAQAAGRARGSPAVVVAVLRRSRRQPVGDHHLPARGGGDAAEAGRDVTPATGGLNDDARLAFARPGCSSDADAYCVSSVSRMTPVATAAST